MEEGVPLTQLARERHIPLRTARRWVQQYHRQGLAGLTRKTRTDAGQRKLPHELQQLIEGLALRRPPPTAAAVHRQVKAIAQEQRWQEQGWAVPSYSRVHNIIQQLDPSMIMLAHQGAKMYQDAFDLLYRREASRPNEMWQADHMLLDIWVLDPSDPSGKLARPWLTVILDDYSRAVAGYGLSLQAPSALQTALVLRQAIWRKENPIWHVCGIPQTLYTDHGSDFISHHMEQVSIDLHMELVFSLPGRPRGRGRIERFFHSVNQLFLSDLPGYAPPGVPSVPRVPFSAKLTFSQLDQRLQTWILNDYHHRVHGETGAPPQERWEESGFLPQLPMSLAQLDLLLLTVAKPRKVQQDGIHFQGSRYLDLTLAAYVGEAVVIRYDPSDLAEIRVYHEDGFLCRAVCQELADQMISLKEIVQARTQRRRQVRDDLKERMTLVDQLLMNRPTEAPEVATEVSTVETIAVNVNAAKSDQPRLKRYINE